MELSSRSLPRWDAGAEAVPRQDREQGSLLTCWWWRRPGWMAAAVHAARKGIRTRCGHRTLLVARCSIHPAIENFISVKETEGPASGGRPRRAHVKQYNVTSRTQRAEALVPGKDYVEVNWPAAPALLQVEDGDPVHWCAGAT